MKYYVLLVLIHSGIILACETPTNNTANFKKYEAELLSPHLPLEYDSKGLQPFFNLANSFMNTVQPKSFGKEFKGIEYDKILDHKDKIKDYEVPILIAAAFGLLFALFMPIIGFCFCCCRCAGNCGGKMFQDPKSSTQHTKCGIMAFILLVVTIFMLCGVLFMFVTNNRIHSTVEDVGLTYEQALNDVRSVANSTIEAAQHVRDTIIPCIIRPAIDDISNPGIQLNIGVQLKNLISSNVSGVLSKALVESQKLDAMYKQLQDVDRLKNELEGHTNTLKNNLTNIKNDLNTIMTDCVNAGMSTECDPIQAIHDSLNVNIDFTTLPDTTAELNNLKTAIDFDLTGNIKIGQATINDIPTTVVDKSNSVRNDARTKINKGEGEVKTQLNKVIKDITDGVVNLTRDHLKHKDEYTSKTSKYYKYENNRWHAYIGLSCLMALIVILIGLGLTFAACGYKKDRRPSKRTKVATCGGNCLMSAVGLMFIFSFLFMLFCVIWYVVGIHLYIVCRDMEDGELIDDLYKFKPTDSDEVLKVSQTLKNCRNNMPLFAALDGDRFFNITKNFDIKEHVPDINDEIKKINIDLTDKTILTNDAESSITQFINSGVDDLNYTKFLATLKEKITDVDLTVVSQNLSTVAAGISNTGVKTKIEDVAKKVENVQHTTLATIQQKMNFLKQNVTEVEIKATNLKDGTTSLLNDLKASETFLTSSYVQDEIKKMVQQLSDRILGWLTQGTDYITKELKESWFKCKPVAQLYDGVHTFACDNVVQNTNGFWLALGWCLLFFIPAIILCVKLAKYFRKMDYDSGYDDNIQHPPYNDKIPLHSIQPNDFIPRPFSTPRDSYVAPPGRSPQESRSLDEQLQLIGDLENRPRQMSYNSTGDDNATSMTSQHTSPPNEPAQEPPMYSVNTPSHALQFDDVAYDHNPPPPYNQHENSGYTYQ
ncbi:prominin-1-A-like [Hydractinia symbiolongicarpus]|uniref:prominin-1-A-like n=1 Tax=Hydractinia symbiolongicarpus TaxID=13093 RepID=UPI002551C436|nr:prominin-1-A-like [Hydractinia symbiolongicarpus]